MEKIVGESNYEFFKTLFATLDKDNSGTLDQSELELALKHTASRPDQIDFYLGLTDDDQSGNLDINEFMFLIVISQCDFEDVQKSTQIFEKFDLNSNNRLEKSELRKCFNEIGLTFGVDGDDTGFEDLFKVLDLDNSGYLNKIEFYMMIEGLRRQVAKKQQDAEYADQLKEAPQDGGEQYQEEAQPVDDQPDQQGDGDVQMYEEM